MAQYLLTSEPWIPVITLDGPQVRSLAGVFEPGVVDVATGDVLEDASILRLLIAVQVAANAEKKPVAQWLTEHADDFDLIHPTRPFMQNADMARFTDNPGAARAIVSQTYNLAGNRSMAFNRFHSLTDVKFDYAAAARLLLLRQSFSIGGRQQFIAAVYGNPATSAKVSVCTNRSFAWIDTGNLVETIELNASLITGKPGTFYFTWPGGNPPIEHKISGALDALTWISRSAYLVPNEGTVEKMMVCDGMRWPVPEKTGYTAETESKLIPHAVYERKAKSAPLTIQGVHVERVLWRQLLGAIANEQPKGSVGDLVRRGKAPAGSRLRITGFGSYQSRIDGPLSGEFPVPVKGFDAAAIDTRIGELMTRHGRSNGSFVRHVTDAKDSAIASRLTSYTAIMSALEPVVKALAAGEITAGEAERRFVAIENSAAERSLQHVTETRPAVAAQITARREASDRKEKENA